MNDHWCARPMAQPKGYPAKYVLDGPGLAALIHEALLDIATSIHEGDTRAERWTDYVLAVSRLEGAGDDASEEKVAELGGDVADAFAALADDLGTALYLDAAEARLIAHKLDDVAGRIGVES